MKNISKIILVAAGLATVVPFVNAADTTTAPAPNTPAAVAPAANHPKMHAALKHRRALQRRIARALNLSADQKAQMKAIGASTRTSIKSIRENASLTPEQKKAQIRSVAQSARAQRVAVLTPDQKTKLEHLRNRVWHRMGGL